MIPVQLQPEPEFFDRSVRTPGTKFLKEIPHPKSHQWRGKEYWQKALPDMRKVYQETCAYCAQKIPYGTGNHSIDHFLPKDNYPALAYEWSNFRYVSSRLNSYKGKHHILDPFEIEVGWFVLSFSSFFIEPNPTLSPETQKAIQETIEVLKLNKDEDLVEERWEWFQRFQSGNISFSHLQEMCPFIAYELERQGLVDEEMIQ